jgi:hypothetical protein
MITHDYFVWQQKKEFPYLDGRWVSPLSPPNPPPRYTPPS